MNEAHVNYVRFDNLFKQLDAEQRHIASSAPPGVPGPPTFIARPQGPKASSSAPVQDVEKLEKTGEKKTEEQRKRRGKSRAASSSSASSAGAKDKDARPSKATKPKMRSTSPALSSASVCTPRKRRDSSESTTKLKPKTKKADLLTPSERSEDSEHNESAAESEESEKRSRRSARTTRSRGTRDDRSHRRRSSSRRRRGGSRSKRRHDGRGGYPPRPPQGPPRTRVRDFRGARARSRSRPKEPAAKVVLDTRQSHFPPHANERKRTPERKMRAFSDDEPIAAAAAPAPRGKAAAQEKKVSPDVARRAPAFSKAACRKKD